MLSIKKVMPRLNTKETVHQGFFRAHDGARLYFESVGKGPPVVFCYGLACNIKSFRFQRESLKRQYQCVFWDYRGHGKSAHNMPDRVGGLETHARDLKYLLSHLGIKRASVLGHSYGVNVSFYFALKYPKSVSNLIWINGLLDLPLHTMFRRPYAHYVFHGMKYIYDHYPLVFKAGWRRVVDNPLFPYLSVAPLGFNLLHAKNHDVQNYVEGVAKLPYVTFMELMSQFYQIKDSRKTRRLKELPVLLCGGLADRVTPVELQIQLAGQIPGGKFVGIPEGSHNVHLERPRMVNRRIREWLRDYAE